MVKQFCRLTARHWETLGHDKVKHLVIKSKCSQEGFQAKQSWEKLLSWPSLSYKLTSFVFITTSTWLLQLKLTEETLITLNRNRGKTWILFLSPSLSQPCRAYCSWLPSVPGVLVSWPEGQQARHHHIILLIVNRFLALSALSTSPQVSGQWWKILKCLGNWSIPLFWPITSLLILTLFILSVSLCGEVFYHTPSRSSTMRSPNV